VDGAYSAARTTTPRQHKVAELIDGGDMSPRRGLMLVGITKPRQQGPLCCSTAVKIAPPRHDADLCEYLLPNNSEEFAYVFRNGEWVCYNMHEFYDKLPEIVEIPSVHLEYES
jgi:hypothetical protein